MPFDANDPETKAAIKAAAQAAADEAVEGLKTKNTELLAKLKKAQKDATIDPADHAALQAELDAAQNKLTEATKALKAATIESDKIKKQYETESKVAHNLLVDNGLSTALLAVGVKDPDFFDMAKAKFSPLVKLEADGEKRTAKIGDKTIDEHIKEWSVTDAGKKCIGAPNNSGGGGVGGAGGSGDKKTMTRTAFEGLDPVAKMTAMKEGVTLTAA
ncbi:MAG: hypothetical protein H8E17_08635 [Deltaproteobacteria bacterium]|nr:hypothetical protein [Deltaproteobacteria bacterium]